MQARRNLPHLLRYSPATTMTGSAYIHCGRTEEQNDHYQKQPEQGLHQWKSADAPAAKNMMSWKVNEIMDLQKDNEHTMLSLYYSPRELTEGKLLRSTVKGK